MADPKTTTEQNEKVEKLVKPTKTTNPELPANVVVTTLDNGTVIYNAVALTQ